MNQFNNKKTVLVTGSGGLLGSELIKQLLEEDKFNVIGMTSKVDKLTGKYTKANLIVVSNQTWKDELKKKKLQVDILVNCAFPRSSKAEELALGISFTEQLVKDSIKMDIKNIINISSQSVYTQKNKKDVNEQSNVKPESLYSMTKYSCERVVSILCEQHNINYSNIRLASLTGLDFEVRMTNRFVKSVINNEKITINGGKQQLSYLDVRDAAKGLIKMIKQNTGNWNRIYNLGNDESFTLIVLVDAIKNEAEKYNIQNVQVEINEGDSNYNNIMNNSLFFKQFSFQPHFDLYKMINELFEYHLS